jgi:hypothetical protein
VPRNAHRGGEHETLDNNNERARYQKRPARHRHPLRQTDETAHEQTGVRQGSWQTDLGLQVVFFLIRRYFFPAVRAATTTATTPIAAKFKKNPSRKLVQSIYISLRL